MIKWKLSLLRYYFEPYKYKNYSLVLVKTTHLQVFNIPQLSQYDKLPIDFMWTTFPIQHI